MSWVVVSVVHEMAMGVCLDFVMPLRSCSEVN